MKAAYQGIVLEPPCVGYIDFPGLPSARKAAGGGVRGGDR
jgi:hypothetical protein